MLRSVKLVAAAAAVSVACTLAAGAAARAAVFSQHDVDCNGSPCGTMTIDTYKTLDLFNFGNASDPLYGMGADIHGTFSAVAKHKYHYLQAIIVNDKTAEAKFTDKTDIPAPLLDPPPGGYSNALFDFLPYYDQANDPMPFPTFYDEPKNSFGLVPLGDVAKVQFETWVVCVIDETFGDNPIRASDDTFDVAALLGWSWGYQIRDNRDNPPGFSEDPSDFTVSLLDFEWLTGVPTPEFISALSITYGADHTGDPDPGIDARDRFYITLSDCVNCIPEPGTIVLWLFATAAILLLDRNRSCAVRG